MQRFSHLDIYPAVNTDSTPQSTQAKSPCLIAS